MLEYRVYWDDGFSNTSGYLLNGSYYNVSHRWIEPGYYSIHVEVTDGELTSSSYSYISIRTNDQIIDPITPAINYFYVFIAVFFLISVGVLRLIMKKKSLQRS